MGDMIEGGEGGDTIDGGGDGSGIVTAVLAWTLGVFAGLIGAAALARAVFVWAGARV
jgi:hypothetical protein